MLQQYARIERERHLRQGYGDLSLGYVLSLTTVAVISMPDNILNAPILGRYDEPYSEGSFKATGRHTNRIIDEAGDKDTPYGSADHKKTFCHWNSLSLCLNAGNMLRSNIFIAKTAKQIDS